VDLPTAKQARNIQELFTRIASRYDLMNRLMTFGQDQRWRREVVRRAAPGPAAHLLDLGTGTGDLARAALQQFPTARLTAADFTFEMMRLGKRRDARPAWISADAACLPFPPQTFDAAVSGFLVRNVPDVPGVLREQRRVLKPGGRIVILDTTRPRPGGFVPPVRHAAPAWTVPGQAGTTPAAQPGIFAPPVRHAAPAWTVPGQAGTTPAAQPGIFVPPVRHAAPAWTVPGQAGTTPAAQPGIFVPPVRHAAPAWTVPGQAGTTPAAQPGIFAPLVWLHLHIVIPLLARLVTRHGEDYQYLRISTENFLPAEALAIHMEMSGFREVGFRRLMFGTVAIHWGVRA